MNANERKYGRLRVVGLVACVLLICVHSRLSAADDQGVKVRETTVTLPWHTSTPRWKKDPNSNGAFYPLKGSRKRSGDRTFGVVVLANRFVEVHVSPELGGAVIRAVDQETGDDWFFWEGKAKDYLPWWESGVKASFPFREHGVRTDQPASWRVVEHDDGSKTLAMWMEFSRFDRSWNRHMFGRFSNMMLTQLVTLRPDENLFRITYRVVNPAPYKQGLQFWNDALFPRHHEPAPVGVAQEDQRPTTTPADTRIIMPFRRVSGHSGKDLRELTEAEKETAHYKRGASIFAWDHAAGFVGLYYPSVRVNRLRITPDLEAAPGAKFFIHGMGPAAGQGDWRFHHNYVEWWGGTDHVFEGVERWIGPGEVFAFTHAFAMTRGVGEADYADQRVVVAVEADGDDPRVQVVTHRPVEAVTVVVDGRVVVDAQPCGPRQPLSAPLPPGGAGGGSETGNGTGDQPAKRRAVVVRIGDTVAFEGRLPLVPPTDKAKHPQILRALEHSAENNELAGNALAMGKSVQMARYPAESVAARRVAYRLGRNDIDWLAAMDLTRAEKDELRRLAGVSWLERGDIDSAMRTLPGDDAGNYYAAIGWIHAEDHGHAEAVLKRLLAARPQHWEARLLLAYLEATDADEPDTTRIKALAAEDPADPRVQWVLKRAGLPSEVGRMLEEPGAPRRLEEFVAATRGTYLPPRRMKTRVDQAKKPGR